MKLINVFVGVWLHYTPCSSLWSIVLVKWLKRQHNDSSNRSSTTCRPHSLKLAIVCDLKISKNGILGG